MVWRTVINAAKIENNNVTGTKNMFEQKTFHLMKNTLEGKVRNIDIIPGCSKDSLMEALRNASSVEDLIGINKAIIRLVNKA